MIANRFSPWNRQTIKYSNYDEQNWVVWMEPYLSPWQRKNYSPTAQAVNRPQAGVTEVPEPLAKLTPTKCHSNARTIIMDLLVIDHTARHQAGKEERTLSSGTAYFRRKTGKIVLFRRSLSSSTGFELDSSTKSVGAAFSRQNSKYETQYSNTV
jgi:hypothetical protein